jgi:phosphoglycerate dehydrogenase-like enzyme
MAKSSVSRRRFIAAAATSGVAATAQFTPFSPFANAQSDRGPLPPERIIKIVSFQNLSADDERRIKAVSKNIELYSINDQHSSHIEDAEVIFGGVDPSILPRAKKLRWVQVWAAGVEGTPKEVMAHPLVLTNMQRVFAPVIAESAIAMLLCLTRGLVQHAIPNFNQHKWVNKPPEGIVLEDLYNKTIGIVGMGGIGSETARRLHYGFGMKVLATDAKPMHKPDFVHELRDPGWLLEMVPQVDVLMSAAPVTNITKGMFNEEVFSKMKPSAYFINVSRGGLIEQNALVSALKNKKIRGAGIDVAAPEPLPADHPFWACPNLVITAHNSAYADSRFERMISLVVENTRRYSQGLPLMNIVDKEKGY